ncbi:hypothetical protein L288_18530 [Sphingobium quisquiliarum P25]|uniref:DUF4365 domain-containing protein n=1 Tax=Sphingobium quisquiliarum P25 TaxID=1329909 RepID=T0HLN5_9SPHN|nr:hypothetical protein [Sphingobium quisquiliarum]EQB00235.1 hypothetical protein L288_18530 [Sphingobium quisquiliarum P25]
MIDFWASEHSVLREKVLEHALLTELAKAILFHQGVTLEVLRPEFDANGYDLVIEANGVLRHVQLKAMRKGGKRAHVDIALALADKPAGCVVWFTVDTETLAMGPFLWLGGKPGEPLPDLGDRVTRHTKANAEGKKAERAGHRRVPIARFTRLDTIQDLAMAMFGKPAALATTRSHAMNGTMTESRCEYDGPVGVTEPMPGWDFPRQVIRYERRNGKVFATWIAPSGVLTHGEVPLFQEGDGFYDVFGRFLGNSAEL